MSEVINFLKENSLIYLATSGLDGNAKVRPILFYFEEDGKPYFCTGNTKPMFKELDANPNCEMVVATPEFVWLRIAGKVPLSRISPFCLNTTFKPSSTCSKFSS